MGHCAGTRTWAVCKDNYDSPCPWTQYHWSMDFRSGKILEIKSNPLTVAIKGLRLEGLGDLSKITLVTGERQNEVLGLLIPRQSDVSDEGGGLVLPNTGKK